MNLTQLKLKQEDTLIPKRFIFFRQSSPVVWPSPQTPAPYASKVQANKVNKWLMYVKRKASVNSNYYMYIPASHVGIYWSLLLLDYDFLHPCSNHNIPAYKEYHQKITSSVNPTLTKRK